MGQYNDQSIKVLTDIEHVQKVPLMYISGQTPSMQMFEEILSNALDEALNGYATEITVSIDYDNSVITIEDDGRGLPQGMNETLGIPTIQVIYSKLNSGGKYDHDSYEVSGGLHGVGSCVVNALSKYLQVTTWRDKHEVQYIFKEGILADHYENSRGVGHGTRVLYQINTDLEIFSEDKLLDYKKDIEMRMSLLATLYPDLKFIYNNQTVNPTSLESLMTGAPYILKTIDISNRKLKMVLNWSDSTKSGIGYSYCNLIRTRSGGDHIRGLEEAVSKMFPGYENVIFLGMYYFMSTIYPDVKFEGQSKDRAKSKDLRQYICDTVYSTLRSYFRENPEEKDILIKYLDAKKFTLESKKATRVVPKKDRKKSYMMALASDGFADCTTTDRSKAELTICEGLSAAGSLKQARDIRTQAVLPLRGKFINAYTTTINRLVENREAATLITSLDTGILDDTDLKNCRYDKILIFSDADEDGLHIACLLIAFFARVIPELLIAGRVYLALPPLYGTTLKDGTFIPIRTEEEKEDYISKGYYVQRYKGLGEMTPEQLKVSALDPETRELTQLIVGPDTIETVARIMSGESSNRRDLLVEMGVYR